MSELEIPEVQAPTTVPSTTEHTPGATISTTKDSVAEERGATVNGHGAGFDGVDGHTGKMVTIAVVGAGQRGQIYASYALEHPNEAKVVAVAEPRSHRRKVVSQAHSIPADAQFSSYEGLLKKGKIANAVLICVLDDLHAELVTAFSKQGYHILCEKPMATSVQDCVKMVREVTEAEDPKIFAIGHVLRYSPYNQAVKAVIDSGEIGEIVNIQHIEPVGNQHFAHSFVRGNWHKESETSFALMTKCCHDIDILSFYLSGRPPSRVSSFGSIHHFKPSQKPKEAGNAKRCLDCAYEPQCVWSAKKIYVEPLNSIEDRERWARHVVDADHLDEENVTEALKTSQYGRCVYECGNDVVDHQVVNVEYEGGVTASMTMSAFTEDICDRGTRIQGTKGEIVGDMKTFSVFSFLSRTKTLHTPPLEGGGHGGGDAGLARAFVKAVSTNTQSELKVTPEEVLNSHLLVFAAEKARRNGGVVGFGEFKQGAMNGEKVWEW